MAKEGENHMKRALIFQCPSTEVEGLGWWADQQIRRPAPVPAPGLWNKAAKRGQLVGAKSLPCSHSHAPTAMVRAL